MEGGESVPIGRASGVLGAVGCRTGIRPGQHRRDFRQGQRRQRRRPAGEPTSPSRVPRSFSRGPSSPPPAAAIAFPIFPSASTRSRSSSPASRRRCTATIVDPGRASTPRSTDSSRFRTVQETVTVSGASPVVDTKSRRRSAPTSAGDLLDAIPSARDPWVILEQTPGWSWIARTSAATSRGSSRRSASLAAHGNQQWNVDGGTVTDMASSVVAGLLRLRLVRGNPDHDRRRRRVAEGRRRRDQPVVKSGSNQLQGSARYLRRQQALRANECAGRGDRGRAAARAIRSRTWPMRLRGRRPDQEGQGVVLGRGEPQPIRVGVIGFLKPGASAATRPTSTTSRPISRCEQSEPEVELPVDDRAQDDVPVQPRRQDPRLARSRLTSCFAATTRQTGGATLLSGPTSVDGQQPAAARRPIRYNDRSPHSLTRTVLRPCSGSLRRSGQHRRPLRQTLQRQHPADYEAAKTGWTRQLLPGEPPRRAITRREFGVRYRSTPYRGDHEKKTGGGAHPGARPRLRTEQGSRRRDGDADTSRELWECSAYFNDSMTARPDDVPAGACASIIEDRAIAANIAASPILPGPAAGGRLHRRRFRRGLQQPVAARSPGPTTSPATARPSSRRRRTIRRPRHRHRGQLSPTGRRPVVLLDDPRRRPSGAAQRILFARGVQCDAELQLRSEQSRVRSYADDRRSAI